MLKVFKLSCQLGHLIEILVSTSVRFSNFFRSILDVYISMVSYSHLICAKGIYVVSISTTIETDNPMAEI